MPRTKEEFDKWFNESSGDPWGYSHKSVRNRLLRSIEFIKQFINNNFNGNVLELGAFNGDFSVLLCRSFPNADIIVNDISEVALKEAKEKTSQCKNIKYYCEDLLKINNQMISNNNETVILLLECLYYLKPDERKTALINIKNNFPESDVFISAPVTGGKYFTEEELLSMFKELNYEPAGSWVLNMKKYSFLIKYLNGFLNRSDLLREKLANQVIFYFKPRRKL